MIVGGGVLLFLLGDVVPCFSAVFGDKGTRCDADPIEPLPVKAYTDPLTPLPPN